MRSLKFRAWDIDNKKYEYDIAIRPINRIIGVEIFNNEMYPVEFRRIVEQYTGLKDKNGKEIYEGDIMEFGIAGAENRGVVGYEEDFGSYETYTSKGYIIASLFTSRGKIIGNIHENPELLEDK